MNAAPYPGLPAAWVDVLQRRAPNIAREFLADAQRYLADGGSERVPKGREAETLKNLVFAYFEPAQRDTVLYDLAIAGLRSAATRPAMAAGVVAVAGAAVVGLAVSRRRRS